MLVLTKALNQILNWQQQHRYEAAHNLLPLVKLKAVEPLIEALNYSNERVCSEATFAKGSH